MYTDWLTDRFDTPRIEWPHFRHMLTVHKPWATFSDFDLRRPFSLVPFSLIQHGRWLKRAVPTCGYKRLSSLFRFYSILVRWHSADSHRFPFSRCLPSPWVRLVVTLAGWTGRREKSTRFVVDIRFWGEKDRSTKKQVTSTTVFQKSIVWASTKKSMKKNRFSQKRITLFARHSCDLFQQ